MHQQQSSHLTAVLPLTAASTAAASSSIHKISLNQFLSKVPRPRIADIAGCFSSRLSGSANNYIKPHRYTTRDLGCDATPDCDSMRQSRMRQLVLFRTRSTLRGRCIISSDRSSRFWVSHDAARR